MQPPPWLRFLAWMELLAGIIGLLSYSNVAIAYPSWFPVWHNLLAVAFFGANILAGILLLQGREHGVALSFMIQLLQVVFWNSGVVWIARAGLQLTPVISSTGAILYGGPAAEFMAHTVDTTFFSGNSGVAFSLTLGWALKPLDQASFACGVNLVALYFTLKLWQHLGAAQRNPPATDAPPARAGWARWSLPAAGGFIGLVGLFMLFGGPKSVNPPHPRWIIATGDTLEMLYSGPWYEASVGLASKSVNAGHFYLVQYRSDIRDPARDGANSVALAQLVCRHADSLGMTRIVVRPFRRQFGGFFNYWMNYRFAVDTAARCSQIAQ